MLAWLYLGLIGDGASLKVFHVSNSTASGNNFSPEKPMGIFPINTEHEMRQTATAVTPLEGSFPAELRIVFCTRSNPCYN